MPATPRRTRSDALQNRERLLEVAAQAFAEQGLDTAPAAIAKQAGVGVGTLYRHFPTREVLIDAAYRRQLTQVCEKVNDLLTQHPAAEATRMWMEHFIHYATAKSGMSEALNAVIASGIDPYSDSRALLTDAVATLLTASTPETEACERTSPRTMSYSSWVASPIPCSTAPKSKPVRSSTYSWTR